MLKQLFIMLLAAGSQAIVRLPMTRRPQANNQDYNITSNSDSPINWISTF